MRCIDLRSDTVTQPTAEMRQAMADADVGDDILGEDPTVQALEAYSASLFGKDRGLFVISGTMANQVALHAMTARGDEILAGEESHIFNLEVGGLAALSGIQCRVLRAYEGRFWPSDVLSAIRAAGVQAPVTRVLCLENTYDLNRGIPLPASYINEMAHLAHSRGLQVYIDGARIFNAAMAESTSSSRLCEQADVVQFCLTKGLAAPIGSVLVGSKEFIDKARWVRQRFGGGMRQAGHMAAAGLVALRTMMERLAEDHVLARRLAEGLAAIDPRLVDPISVKTNIIRVDFGSLGMTSVSVSEKLKHLGIKVKVITDTACRMVTHWGITGTEVDEVIDSIRSVL